MRWLVSAWLLCAALVAPAAFADPAFQPKRELRAQGVNPVRLGTATHWVPERLGRRIGLGVGWTIPQRWYDVDGQLLTERSLLTPGGDLERSGLYFAVRF
jgi:hypothetical protein